MLLIVMSRMYVLGGEEGWDRYHDTIECYDPAEDSWTVKCNQCNKTYTDKRPLEKHIKVHTSWISSSPASPPSQESDIHTHMNSLWYFIDWFIFWPISIFSLFGHSTTVHCEQPFKCNQCNKTFTRKQFLTNHSRIHPTSDSMSDIFFITQLQLKYQRWDMLLK